MTGVNPNKPNKAQNQPITNKNGTDSLGAGKSKLGNEAKDIKPTENQDGLGDGKVVDGKAPEMTTNDGLKDHNNGDSDMGVTVSDGAPELSKEESELLKLAETAEYGTKQDQDKFLTALKSHVKMLKSKKFKKEDLEKFFKDFGNQLVMNGLTESDEVLTQIHNDKDETVNQADLKIEQNLKAKAEEFFKAVDAYSRVGLTEKEKQEAQAKAKKILEEFTAEYGKLSEDVKNKFIQGNEGVMDRFKNIEGLPESAKKFLNTPEAKVILVHLLDKKGLGIDPKNISKEDEAKVKAALGLVTGETIKASIATGNAKKYGIEPEKSVGENVEKIFNGRENAEKFLGKETVEFYDRVKAEDLGKLGELKIADFTKLAKEEITGAELFDQKIAEIKRFNEELARDLKQKAEVLLEEREERFNLLGIKRDKDKKTNLAASAKADGKSEAKKAEDRKTEAMQEAEKEIIQFLSDLARKLGLGSLNIQTLLAALSSSTGSLRDLLEDLGYSQDELMRKFPDIRDTILYEIQYGISEIKLDKQIVEQYPDLAPTFLRKNEGYVFNGIMLKEVNLSKDKKFKQVGSMFSSISDETNRTARSLNEFIKQRRLKKKSQIASPNKDLAINEIFANGSKKSVKKKAKQNNKSRMSKSITEVNRQWGIA